MRPADWLVLIAALAASLAYGVYKGRSARTLEGYFLNNRATPWYMILLGIMGTQASAVTFLSAPGQAFTDGMRFVQYYFGLPLAMVILCISFVPVFHRLKVFTAYEFLERRFDGKTRLFTSFLFLLQRGLSTGISISAPSIILSSLLGWNILWTNVLMGGLLVIYTVSGGARAVAYTQQWQFIVILAGMTVAGLTVVHLLPAGVGFTDALHLGGKSGKMNIITDGRSETGFRWDDRYNLWSGLIGGFFLQLSYFGTDQSQVGRYITAPSMRESRLGLLLNGLVKIPMQFLILLMGVLVFAYYQYKEEPVFFNQSQIERIEKSKFKDSLHLMMADYEKFQRVKQETMKGVTAEALSHDRATIMQVRLLQQQQAGFREKIRRWLDATGGDSNDTNYIFLRFVLDKMPTGLVGLLVAVIFLSAWGSIAAALNSLASSSIIDFHRRFANSRTPRDETDPAVAAREYRFSKGYTLAWGIFCVIIAQLAYNIGHSLIEAVNILGSLFYGVILGIFLVALYLKRVRGTPVFIAALVVEAFVIAIEILTLSGKANIGFLWLNAIGAAGVVGLSLLLNAVIRTKPRT